MSIVVSSCLTTILNFKRGRQFMERIDLTEKTSFSEQFKPQILKVSPNY